MEFTYAHAIVLLLFVPFLSHYFRKAFDHQKELKNKSNELYKKWEKR